jgi:hypothetical protein
LLAKLAREEHGAAGRPDIPPQLEAAQRRQTARLDRVSA